MKRQMLGNSMLEVPAVAAGCMRIHTLDESQVDEYIHTCLEVCLSRQNFAEKISSFSQNAESYQG